MKQATEPMGFVIEKECPFIPEIHVPGSPVEVYVAEPDPGAFADRWEKCPGKKFEIVGHHSGPTPRPFAGATRMGVCEHMGRLVE